MKQTLNRHEKRNQRTAVIVMLAITVPILLIYGSFFKMAFFDDAGNFTLGNFQFLYTTDHIQRLADGNYIVYKRNKIKRAKANGWALPPGNGGWKGWRRSRPPAGR